MKDLFAISALPIWMVLSMVAVVQLGCAAPKFPDNRGFGSILNNDATNIMYASTGADTTPEEFRRGIGFLLDARPGLLAQSTGQPDPVFYRSQVATPFSEYVEETNRVVPAMRALAAAGTDPLQLAVEVCRERGIPVVASYRMNSEDFGPRALTHFDFARDNPQFVIQIPGVPPRGCLDPAHPEVYAHRMAIFREVIEKYDVDGLEFDFKRWIFMISEPQKNHVILTRMVRETRQMLDEVAKHKGKKRMILGVRVEPVISGDLRKEDIPGGHGPPWNRSCEASGLDIRTWVEEGLVDYICPSHFWPEWPGLPHTAEFVELAKGKDIGIYPTIFPKPAWTKDDSPIEPGDEAKVRRYKNELCGLALRCYAEGADGISTFNWLPHHQRGMQPDPNRPSWGDGHKGMQMKIHPLLADRAALEAYRVSPVLLD